MDINSRINWMPGMELTAETFKGLDVNFDIRQQVMLRAALGGMRLGLLSGAPFSCNGIFVRNTFEIEHFQCTAILPSGRIVNVDESAVVNISTLYSDEYYLTVGLSDEVREFAKDDVSYVAPQYIFSIHTLEEMGSLDVIPVARFSSADGVFSRDTSYVPPCLLLSANPCFRDFADIYIHRLGLLTSHANLENGEGKRALLRYMFRLQGYNWESSVHDFVLLTQEIAHCIDYYIVKPHTDTPADVPQPTPYDIQKWLQWLADYFTDASSILDTVVLDNTVIDYDALLAQAKAELYDRLNPELYEKLKTELSESLRAEIKSELEQHLFEYINGQLKNDLYQSLHDKLSGDLYEMLYTELFEHLFNALYMPETEEDEFTPLI